MTEETQPPREAAGPLHDFLAGIGRDSRGRMVEDVLAFSNPQLEGIHNFIQWLFPLRTRSAAQPDAPTLSEEEIGAIRADPRAQATLERAAERMLRFYRETDGWLTWQNHNHLRISRIIHSLRLLVDERAARAFHSVIEARLKAEGSPVNPRSQQIWSDALRG